VKDAKLAVSAEIARKEAQTYGSIERTQSPVGLGLLKAKEPHQNRRKFPVKEVYTMGWFQTNT